MAEKRHGSITNSLFRADPEQGLAGQQARAIGLHIGAAAAARSRTSSARVRPPSVTCPETALDGRGRAHSAEGILHGRERPWHGQRKHARFAEACPDERLRKRAWRAQ